MDEVESLVYMDESVKEGEPPDGAETEESEQQKHRRLPRQESEEGRMSIRGMI